MKQTTMIDNTVYEIVGGKTLVDDTEYSIKGGKTLVKGTEQDITFRCKVVIDGSDLGTSVMALYSNLATVMIDGNVYIVEAGFDENFQPYYKNYWEIYVEPGTIVSCKVRGGSGTFTDERGQVEIDGVIVFETEKGSTGICDYTVSTNVLIQLKRRYFPNNANGVNNGLIVITEQ